MWSHQNITVMQRDKTCFPTTVQWQLLHLMGSKFSSMCMQNGYRFTFACLKANQENQNNQICVILFSARTISGHCTEVLLSSCYQSYQMCWMSEHNSQYSCAQSRAIAAQIETWHFWDTWIVRDQRELFNASGMTHLFFCRNNLVYKKTPAVRFFRVPLLLLADGQFLGHSLIPPLWFSHSTCLIFNFYCNLWIKSSSLREENPNCNCEHENYK